VTFFVRMFLPLVALDGAVGLLDSLLRLGGVTVLGGLHVLVSLALLPLAPGMLLLAVLIPEVPKRVVLPPLAFLLWGSLLAMPLPLWLGIEGMGVALSILELALAGGLLLKASRTETGPWAVPVQGLTEVSFSFRHTVAWSAVVALTLPATAVYVVLSGEAAVAHATDNWVRVDLRGLTLQERVLVRGDSTVRLVGMMHIGGEGTYGELYDTFPEECLILTEGVSDEQGLLPDFSYDLIAEQLGLESQGTITFSGKRRSSGEGGGGSDPRTRRADVDVSTFHPKTLAMLRGLAHVMDAPDGQTLVRRYVKMALQEVDQETLDAVFEDLLDRRNEVLLGHIRTAVTEAELVIVPWGALHLSWIEEQLLSDGYEVHGGNHRMHIRWRGP
jgi:hypothetical protein